MPRKRVLTEIDELTLLDCLDTGPMTAWALAASSGLPLPVVRRFLADYQIAGVVKALRRRGEPTCYRLLSWETIVAEARWREREWPLTPKQREAAAALGAGG